MRILLVLLASVFSFSSFAEKSVAKASWETLPSKSWEKIQIEDWISAKLAQQIKRVLNSDEFLVTAQVSLLSEVEKNRTWQPKASDIQKFGVALRLPQGHNVSGLPKDIFKRIDRIQVQIQIPSRSSTAEEMLIQALPAQVLTFVHPAKVKLELTRVSLWGGGFWKKLLALDQTERILTYLTLLVLAVIAFVFLQFKKMWVFLKNDQMQSLPSSNKSEFIEEFHWPEIEIKVLSRCHPVFQYSDQVLKQELSSFSYSELMDLVAGLSGLDQTECLRILDQVDPVISKVLLNEIKDLPEVGQRQRANKSKALLQNLSHRLSQSSSAKSFALPQAKVNLLKAFSIHT